MFNRYAQNLLAYGTLAWDPGGDPTYGVTAAMYPVLLAIPKLLTAYILPDDLTIATTEVGLPTALGPHRVVVDLAGLNETSIAKTGFDPGRILREYQPDLLYMVHPHYTDLQAAIEQTPGFRDNYDYWTAEELRARLGVALRKSSPYYPQMRAIIDEQLSRPGR